MQRTTGNLCLGFLNMGIMGDPIMIMGFCLWLWGKICLWFWGIPFFFYKIRPFSLFETNSFGVQYPNFQRLPYPELQITYLYNLVYICIYLSLGSKRWFPHRRGASTAFSRVHPILKRLETARTCVSLAAASLVQRLKIPLPRRGWNWSAKGQNAV